MFRSLAFSALLIGACAAWGQEKPTVIPPPATGEAHAPATSEKADLAGGCYWGTQGIFEHVKGIDRVVAGFTGGHSDDDGGAESVMITFNPKVISYGQLLQIFFSVVHDPTQLNRQGPDVGAGYRSDIFYMSDEQRRIAQAYIAQLGHAKSFPRPIVTRVDAFTAFNQVDLAQQDFMLKNPHLDYIEVNDVPKLASLKQLFPDAYRSLPLQYR
ncbi:MAG TPA: peptide-methionine (S)-S-oxide reductase MsrA [Steroidobacteraceae bacterium]|nr:peptide-methionine (S)-S-oxide reductase MsrA [Steroidobacteraceae bacterium]